MKKYVFTFGHNHLVKFRLGQINIKNPMQISLIVEGKDYDDARDRVFKSPIGNEFSFQYDYSEAKEFKERFNMVEIPLKDLLKTYIGD